MEFFMSDIIACPSKNEKSYCAGTSFLPIIFYFFLFPQICTAQIGWQNQSSPLGNETLGKVQFVSPYQNGINFVEGSRVQLKVYDVLGNEVATLVDEYKSVGMYKVEFNTTNINYKTSSGIYFYQLKAGDFVQAKKMILLE